MTENKFLTMIAAISMLSFALLMPYDIQAQPSDTVTMTTHISPQTISEGESILLLDTSSIANMTVTSVNAHLPCDSNNTPLTKIVAGLIGDTTNVISSSNDLLGQGLEGMCLYHNSINATTASVDAVNRIYLNHTGTEDVTIPQGVVVSLTGLYDITLPFDVTGLVVYYTFEESPANTAPQLLNHCDETTSNSCASADATSQGSMTSSDHVSGIIGNAWELDGTDDYASIPNNFDITNVQKFSVSMWMKSDNLTTGDRLFHFWQSGDAGRIYVSEQDIQDRTTLNIYDGTNQDEVNAQEIHLDDGDWHHVVAVRETSALVLYIDGTEAGRDNSLSVSLDTLDTKGIGKRFDLGGVQFTSETVDEFMVFKDRALTAEEVSQLYNNGNGLSLLD